MEEIEKKMEEVGGWERRYRREKEDWKREVENLRIEELEEEKLKDSKMEEKRKREGGDRGIRKKKGGERAKEEHCN